MIEDPNIQPHYRACDVIDKIHPDTMETEYWILYPMSWTFEQHKATPWQIRLFLEWNNQNTPDILGKVERLVKLKEVADVSYGHLPNLFSKMAGLTIEIYYFHEVMDFRVSPNLHTCSGGPWPPSFQMYAIEFKCLYFNQMVKQNYGVRWNGKEIKPQ